ncbi:hypothetical protein [Modestobacter sp. NPDC049651]|uniref:hypothetical protein n=1 Tax=unclassified Modestobacter TaxID=2643866 RepID=UPI0034086039
MTSAAPDVELSGEGHHLPAAGLAVVAAALLAGLPAVLDDAGRFAAVLVLQLALVAGWVVGTGVRGRAGALVIGGVAAVAADLSLVLPDRPDLDGLLTVLGPAFLVAVVHQMTRPAPRAALVTSLASVVLLVSAVSSLAVLLAVGRVPGQSGIVTTTAFVVGAALVVGHLADLLAPRPLIADGVPRGLVGLVLSVLIGVAVALLRGGSGSMLDLLTAATYGAALGGVAALTGLGASYLVAQRTGHGWALSVVQALLPWAAAAPVAYALALHAGG